MIEHLDILNFLIKVAQEKNDNRSAGGHSADIAALCDIARNAFTRDPDVLAKRRIPAGSKVDLGNTAALQNALVENKVDLDEIATAYGTTKDQFAQILRGQVSPDIDLWSLFAISDHAGLSLSVSVSPKPKI
jgi:hypothetical protein